MDAEKIKEIALQMVDATRRAIDRSIAANNADVEVRLVKSTQALESAERRLSRHAEHLASLETRLKAVERK